MKEAHIFTTTTTMTTTAPETGMYVFTNTFAMCPRCPNMFSKTCFKTCLEVFLVTQDLPSDQQHVYKHVCRASETPTIFFHFEIRLAGMCFWSPQDLRSDQLHVYKHLCHTSETPTIFFHFEIRLNLKTFLNHSPESSL